MSRINQLKVYYLADQLVSHEGYHLLLVNEQKAEVWLEKTERKQVTIIRIIQEDLVWKNHIRLDIENVFQTMNHLKRRLYGSRYLIHNVYISSYPFTESLDIFHRPIERDRMSLMTYHLTEFDEVEQQRFKEHIGISPAFHLRVPDEEIDKMIRYLIQKLTQSTVQKRQAIKDLFTFGKPRLTYVLLVINLIIFFLLELNGGSTNIETLIEYGAKYNLAMLEGEWWRLFSAMFLHVGLLHLMMNMLALYYLGSAVEQIYGSIRFLIIYILAGLGGSLASFAFTVNVSAGASGAIFGLFGALLFFGFNHKQVFFQTMGRNILLIIGLNIVFGFIVPQIDNGAHLGGLVMGFLASAFVSLPRNRRLIHQLGGLLLYSIVFLFLLFYGLENPQNQQMVQLAKIEQLIAEEQYTEVIDLTNELLLDAPTMIEPQLLFQRAYAYIALDDTELAIRDLEASVELEPRLVEAHYNLAILYFEIGEIELAEHHIEMAVTIRPDFDDFRELYEQITGD